MALIDQIVKGGRPDNDPSLGQISQQLKKLSMAKQRLSMEAETHKAGLEEWALKKQGIEKGMAQTEQAEQILAATQSDLGMMKGRSQPQLDADAKEINMSRAQATGNIPLMKMLREQYEPYKTTPAKSLKEWEVRLQLSSVPKKDRDESWRQQAIAVGLVKSNAPKSPSKPELVHSMKKFKTFETAGGVSLFNEVQGGKKLQDDAVTRAKFLQQEYENTNGDYGVADFGAALDQAYSDLGKYITKRDVVAGGVGQNDWKYDRPAQEQLSSYDFGKPASGGSAPRNKPEEYTGPLSRESSPEEMLASGRDEVARYARTVLGMPESQVQQKLDVYFPPEKGVGRVAAKEAKKAAPKVTSKKKGGGGDPRSGLANPNSPERKKLRAEAKATTELVQIKAKIKVVLAKIEQQETRFDNASNRSKVKLLQKQHDKLEMRRRKLVGIK